MSGDVRSADYNRNYGNSYTWGVHVVRVKAGYVGQIIFGSEIVDESGSYETPEDAFKAADEALVAAAKRRRFFQ